MRILHILDHSVPQQSGYAFRTLGILRAQRSRGWDTFQLTGPKQAASLSAHERVDGFDFFRTRPIASWAARLPVVGELASMARLVLRMRKVIAEVRPDVLHAHSPVLNALPALLLGRWRDLPVVYEIRAFWEDAATDLGTSREGGWRYRATRALETFAVGRADAVTVICEGLRSDLIARGVPPEKITVIPNAVDLAEFRGANPPDAALAASLGLQGRVVLGFVGSMYHYEGLHLLLRALSALGERRSDIVALLVGGGPQQENLCKQAEELGLRDRVVFAGRVPHGEVLRYYDLVDLMVFPRVAIRLTELVTPLKPLEAMAQQKIVLASDVGGHRELIEDGVTGYLFRAGSVEDLTARIAEVVDRRAEWPAMRERARRFVETERRWSVSVARYEPVYGGLVARARRQRPA
jgi:PEP-CTERM/exosortase A-associated glycosyltransferase